MISDAHPHLRLLDLPTTATWSIADAKATHPSRGRRPLLYVSGEHADRVRFVRIARRWEKVKLLVADSGEEGLDIALNRQPRMVVLDARLSDVDGEKVVKALRERALAPSAPIVVLGHDSAPSERARFVWAGASAYITKPLNVAEIDRTVGELLDVAVAR